MKKLASIFIWSLTSILTLIFNLSFLYFHNSQIKADAHITLNHLPYNFYFSVPKILGAKIINSQQVSSIDPIPQLVYDYLDQHHSPMLESSENFVSIARKYNIDPLFMLSIAQCESNLGKKMPHKTEDIYECHNPFGWGIHQGGTLCFPTWEEGYQAVAKGLKEKYYNKGYKTTEEIMTKYTPSALERGGSWAKCVNHFLGKLNNQYETYLNN